MKKFPRRYRGILFALVMSCTTSLIVSAIILVMHGSHHGFATAWLSAFLTAWPIVFAAILIIAPQVNRLLDQVMTEATTE